MRSRFRYLMVVLLLGVCAVYANSFSNGFHFDDFHTITDNPAVRSPGNLRRIFTDATAFSVLPANQTYRPLLTASLALDYALGHGYVPFWFHLSTVCWFLVLITLLYFYVKLLLDRTQCLAANSWLALLCAAWFGLHPAMAETVNYVIQRGDLYCTLGCVASLYLFGRFTHLRRYGIYLLPFVLAMLSKPPAAVFPALLYVQVLLFEGHERSWPVRLGKSVVAITPSLAAAALLLWLQSAMTPKTFLPSTVSPGQYRLTQPFVWLRYFGSLFLPVHLNVDTDLQPFRSLNGQAIAGIVFVFALLVVAGLSLRTRRTYPVAFGLLWFVITQLPTSLYPLSEVENDHRMFFSFPGLILAVVWTLYLLYERACCTTAFNRVDRAWARRAMATVAILVLGAYAYCAHRRNAVWLSEETLWADDVAKSPHNGRGLMIFGLTRMNAGDSEGALAWFHRALQYTPNYATLHINLAVANGLLAAQGQPALAAVAEEHFLRAIALAPGDDTTHAYYGRWLMGRGRLAEASAQLEAAVALNGQRAMQRDLLLQAYEQSGKAGAARQLAEQTLEAVPGDAVALALLHGNINVATVGPEASLIDASLASFRAGRFQQSIEQAKQALTINARSAEAWNNLGAGYGGLRQWERAIAAEEQALRLEPGLQIAQNNLRWFTAEKSGVVLSEAQRKTVAAYIDLSLRLDQQRHYEESIAAARKALAIDPSSAEAWNNIAAGEEALQRWDEAIAAAQKAVALRPDFQLAKNNLAWSLQQKGAAATR